MSMPFGFMGGPEELQEFIERQRSAQDHREMVGTDIRNQITEFITGQSVHDTWVLWLMIQGMISSQAEGLRISGYVERVMDERGICKGCGENPCKDEQKIRESIDDLKEESRQSAPLYDDIVPNWDNVVSDAMEATSGPEPELDISKQHKKDEQYTADLYYRYNMRPAPSAVNPARVICVGCELEYVSLEDRMIKGPMTVTDATTSLRTADGQA